MVNMLSPWCTGTYRRPLAKSVMRAGKMCCDLQHPTTNFPSCTATRLISPLSPFSSCAPFPNLVSENVKWKNKAKSVRKMIPVPICLIPQKMSILNQVPRRGYANYSTYPSVKPKKNADQVTNQLDLDENDWVTVYRFKYIRLARVVQKMKLYQTAFTCFAVLPVSVGLCIHGALAVEALSFTVGTSALACGMLYVMGQFCSRLVGVIYVSKKDPTLARVAHLNFWGKREDQIIAKNDFVPFSELEDSPMETYVNIKFYSDSEAKLHLCVRLGTVYDKDQFEQLFGTHTGGLIWENKTKKS